jgi:hypothetical protein
MRAVPNTARTRQILQLCENFSFSDQYRFLHPDERDYTYVPSGVLRRNRSHIDYFLISDSIFINVVSCTIAQAFCKNAFDHKHIMLSFKKKRNKGRICINDRILRNPLLDCAVKLAIYECYISEIATVPGGLIEIVVEDECRKLHDIDQQFNELIFLQGYRAVGGGVDGGPAHGLGKGDGLRHTPTVLKEL